MAQRALAMLHALPKNAGGGRRHWPNRRYGNYGDAARKQHQKAEAPLRLTKQRLTRYGECITSCTVKGTCSSRAICR